MYIDTDLTFDQLEGYAFFHRTEIKAIIEDKIKCIDDEIVEFIDNVEYNLDEGEEIIILEKKETTQELRKFYEFCENQRRSELLPVIAERIKEAELNGAYKDYIAIVDNNVYDVLNFQL